MGEAVGRGKGGRSGNKEIEKRDVEKERVRRGGEGKREEAKYREKRRGEESR